MIDLSSLPRFIEAPGGGMWKIISGFQIMDTENVYVKLVDVEKRLEGFELVRIPSRQVQDML